MREARRCQTSPLGPYGATRSLLDTASHHCPPARHDQLHRNEAILAGVLNVLSRRRAPGRAWLLHGCVQASGRLGKAPTSGRLPDCIKSSPTTSLTTLNRLEVSGTVLVVSKKSWSPLKIFGRMLLLLCRFVLQNRIRQSYISSFDIYFLAKSQIDIYFWTYILRANLLL